jgi:hypothetical protein
MLPDLLKDDCCANDGGFEMLFSGVPHAGKAGQNFPAAGAPDPTSSLAGCTAGAHRQCFFNPEQPS